MIEHTHPPVEAVYERGVFRVLNPETVDLPEGQYVRLAVETTQSSEPVDSLELLGSMYDGLSDAEVNRIESIILDRNNFFGDRPVP